MPYSFGVPTFLCHVSTEWQLPEKLSGSRMRKWSKVNSKGLRRTETNHILESFKRVCYQSPLQPQSWKMRCHFMWRVCVYARVWTNGGAAEQMDKCCLVIYQTSELADSVTVALSRVLNLRLSAVRELLETHVTIHVKIANSRNGSE